MDKLKTVTRTQGNNEALKNGSVKPRTFEFDFVEVDPLIAAFRRMVRGLEFDISEMAMTTYLTAREFGKRFTAIPVFIVRAFHHGAILHNLNAGIRSPTCRRSRGCCRGTSTSRSIDPRPTWCRSSRARKWRTCWPQVSCLPRSASISNIRT